MTTKNEENVKEPKTLETVSEDLGVEAPPAPKVTPQEVYSTKNILQAVENPAPRPDFKKASVDEMARAIADAKSQAELEQIAIGNQPLRQGIISGQQAHQARLSNAHINALANLMQAKQTELDNKERARQEFITLYGADPETRPKGMSRREFRQMLLAKGDTPIQLDKEMTKLNLQRQRQALSGAGVGTKFGATTDLANIQDTLLSSRGEDMKVDPNVYLQQRSEFLRQNPTATLSDFDSQFGGLLSEQEQLNLGIASSTRASNRVGRVPSGTRQLGDVTVRNIGQAKAALSLLDELEKTVKDPQNSGIFAPVRGYIRKFNPYDEKAQTVQSQINSAKQLIGKYLEGGVLRKEDEEKYEKILPKIGDSVGVAKAKIDTVKNMIQNRNNAELETLGQAGFNVTDIYSGEGTNGQTTKQEGETSNGLKYTITF